MNTTISDFFDSPTKESYLKAHETIVSSDRFDPGMIDVFDDIYTLADEGKHAEAIELLNKSMDNLALSPLAHHMLFQLYSILDQQEQSIEAFDKYLACIDGIKSTGDGSEHAPYIVVRVSDERDVLAELEKTPGGQRLITVDDRHFDVIECDDDSVYWFDITSAYGGYGG